MRYIITILTICLLTSFAFGQTDTVKRRYTLFHPVPKDKMKDMETDRPDVTESAYTVDAGHFQVESDLFKQIRTSNQESIDIENIFNLANYKIGLTERMDVQLVIPTHVEIHTLDLSTNKIIDKMSGFDDITLRLKYNIWGNSGGKTALAALPFVSFPTSSFSQNGIQGGIIFPFALQLNNGWNFGTQAEVDITREDDNRYHPGFLYSFTFGKSVLSKLDAFAEAFTTYSPFTKKFDAYINGGVIYAISANFNIDAGFNYGISNGSDKIYFTGFSFRY